MQGEGCISEHKLRARALRRFRTEGGMTLRRLAKHTGVDISQLSRMERGERTPPTFVWLAEMFNVTIDDVMAPCPHCSYNPPDGYQCLRCGTVNQGGEP